MHLGIHIGHDPGVAVVSEDGKPVLVYEESKFNGRKWTVFHPIFSLRELIARGMASFDSLTWAMPEQMDADWYHYDMMSYLDGIRRSLRGYLSRRIKWGKEHFMLHHDAHASSAFYASGFGRALVLTVDGSGEDESLAVYLADKTASPHLRKIESLPRAKFSFGEMYSLATVFLGYRSNAGTGHEGKIMGLSSYGSPVHSGKFAETLNPDKELFPKGDWTKLYPFLESLHKPFKLPKESYEAAQANIAASLQDFLESEMLKIVEAFSSKYQGYEHLCLAGGVAMNSLMNGKILKKGLFKDIFVQPMSSDCGLAIGAAYHGASLSCPMRASKWKDAYLGYASKKESEDLGQLLSIYEIPVKRVEVASCGLVQDLAERLATGRIVGIHRGAQEVGARALGNRSILTLPTAFHRDKVNKDVKYREPWRPFAPIVLEEEVGRYFETNRPEPFMTAIYGVKQEFKGQLDGITHIDGTARLQTVSKAQNPFVYNLLTAVGRLGLPPVLLNTSFNINGQPIVRTAYDSLMTFACTKMDDLLVGDELLTKPERVEPVSRSSITPLDRVLQELLGPASEIDVAFMRFTPDTVKLFEQFRSSLSVSRRRTPLKMRRLFANLGVSYFIRWELESQCQSLFQEMKHIGNIGDASYSPDKPLLVFTGRPRVLDTLSVSPYEGEHGFLWPSSEELSFIRLLGNVKGAESVFAVDSGGQAAPLDYLFEVVVKSCGVSGGPHREFVEWKERRFFHSKWNPFLDGMRRVNWLAGNWAANKLRIAIYGAGKHTELMLRFSKLLQASPIAIVDDNPQLCPPSLWGVPVHPSNSLDALGADAVLISSPLSQEPVRRKLLEPRSGRDVVCIYPEADVWAAADNMQEFCDATEATRNYLVERFVNGPLR